MLENFNDYLSIAVLVVISVYGIYCLFTVSNKHHINRMKKREDSYYRFVEDAQDDSDDDLYME